MSEIPAITPQAEAMSKELKRRGFRFIGPTVMYAHMQATGMVNDHLQVLPAPRRSDALTHRRRGANRPPTGPPGNPWRQRESGYNRPYPVSIGLPLPSRMQIGFETIREILEHRLHQDDIERLLDGLDEAGKAELFYRITEMLRRTTALADIANRVNDSLSLDVLFPRLMEVVTEALNADRSTLFLHDPETGELFSRVLQGDTMGEIRFPSHLGVAGSVFTSGEAEIIGDAYADARFNQEVDRKTGYRPATSSACRYATRSAR
jgi:hypothetical protein